MNPYPIKIKFTPAEWRVIEDRLAVADAIADSLTDYPEGEEELAVNASREEIVSAVHGILGPEVALENELELAILRDAIEGSTMPAKALDAIDYSCDPEQEAWGRGVRRACREVEHKFEQATGIEARFPKA